MSDAEVRRHLAGHGPFPVLPARVHFLNTLPLTANGKTDYNRLRSLGPAASDTTQLVAKGPVPDDTVQEEVRRVWASELSWTAFRSSDTFLSRETHSSRFV